MLDPIVWVRLGKLVAVTLFATGVIGATLPRPMPLATRRVFALWFAGPGFGATWLLGFLLVAQLRYSVLAGWLIGSMLLSFVSLHTVLYSVGREDRTSGRVMALGTLALLGSMVLMSLRP